MDRNKRILIVDDQQDLREQLANLLKRSSRKNETTSLVQQMRDRLLGQKKEEAGDEAEFPADEGYIVETVGQGQEAYEKVKQENENNNPYALMFLDMRMPPGWDGLETAKKVRDIDKNIEIVIMTAYADHEQDKIAETVGHPEKLLYIKKPFQPEEIYQLALSLTTKWTLEQIEKKRKEWLETLIRCMSKIKTVATSKQGDIYQNILKAIFTFTKATKGFIALWNDKESAWEIGSILEVEKDVAEKFIKENADRLTESRTTQSFEGKYFLPLKRDNYSAVVILDDLVTQNDPEWYQLLSLLVMTASEVLSSASLFEKLLIEEQKSSKK